MSVTNLRGKLYSDHLNFSCPLTSSDRFSHLATLTLSITCRNVNQIRGVRCCRFGQAHVCRGIAMSIYLKIISHLCALLIIPINNTTMGLLMDEIIQWGTRRMERSLFSSSREVHSTIYNNSTSESII